MNFDSLMSKYRPHWLAVLLLWKKGIDRGDRNFHLIYNWKVFRPM